jgi:dipeptidyl-peptidase-4
VVVDVYGGPHHQQATRALGPQLLRQWIADHGFVVVAIDGHGTPGRGRAWSRAIQGSFGKVPLEDQVSGLSALGARLPELDLGRVGIMGWSFGGYLSALAVLKRPDVFRVAIAGAPVVDWRDYDTAYTERYLGQPSENEAGYEESSLLTYAPKLARPLLLIHGTSDDNVYFFHALKLSEALLRANRRFDFLPLPGFTHMVPDPVVREALYGRMVQTLTAALAP